MGRGTGFRGKYGERKLCSTFWGSTGREIRREGAPDGGVMGEVLVWVGVAVGGMERWCSFSPGFSPLK